MQAQLGSEEQFSFSELSFHEGVGLECTALACCVTEKLHSLEQFPDNHYLSCSFLADRVSYISSEPLLILSLGILIATTSIYLQLTELVNLN